MEDFSMKRAVDIIIIPPQPLWDLVLDVNARSVAAGTATIDLHATHRFPHLSLLMGVMDEAQLDALTEKLAHIAAETAPLSLQFTESKNTALYTPNEGPIADLHERVLQDIDPLLTHDPKPGMYYNTDYTDHWVEQFVSHHSKAQFEPHVTIHAPEEVTDLPQHGIFSKIALCHLGPYNTCEVTLAQFSLSGHHS